MDRPLKVQRKKVKSKKYRIVYTKFCNKYNGLKLRGECSMKNVGCNVWYLIDIKFLLILESTFGIIYLKFLSYSCFLCKMSFLLAIEIYACDFYISIVLYFQNWILSVPSPLLKFSFSKPLFSELSASFE